VRAAAEEAAAYCRSQGADIADLAMRFALQHEYVATTLVGMSKVRSVKRNLAAVGQAPDPEPLATVLAMIEPVANVVWVEGRPENDDPGAVEQQS
jgi:L-galactose dehydrogenase